MGISRKVFMMVAALLLCLPSQAQLFKSNLKKANKYYELHAYKQAIPEYQDALKRNKDDIEALSKLGDCYRYLNQLEEAAQNYARAMQVDRDKVEKSQVLNYAHVLKGLGRYDEAKSWYQLYARSENEQVGNHYMQSCDFAKSQQNSPSSYQITNEFINTNTGDFGAAFYGSRQVAFSSARTDIQRSGSSGGKIANQLYKANVSPSGYLESPAYLNKRFSAEFNEGPATFSPDGRQVVYTRNNFVDGTRQIAGSGMELTIWTAQVGNDGEWLNAKAFPYNGTGYSTGQPSFSPDGGALYFASDRPDGFGGFDIYVSYWNGTDWGAPENLGPVVNSQGNEMAPYFDGTMLFFSSDWHPGMGGLDIFRAEQNNGRWLRIYHLGNTVNSPRDDYGFIYDSFRNIGYFTSNRLAGRGNEDIYRVTRTADNIVLRIKSAADGSPIANAVVDFTNCGEGVYQTDSRGTYSFQAVQGLNCQVVIKKDGYLSSTVQINTVGTNQNKEYDVNLSRLGEAFSGRIINYTTRQPVDGVTITATNQQTGSAMQAISDANGEYLLALSQYAVYAIRFSKGGFRDLNSIARTEDGFDRNILGVTYLIPSTDMGQDPGPYIPDPINNPVNPGNQGDVPAGYSVQVAALSSASLGNKFDNLNSLGDVYSVNEGNKYKVRVGVYPTRADAEKALRSAKTKGYTGAFIVQEAGTIGTGTSGGDLIPKNPGISPTYGQYKVQLAAYSNLKNFDAAKAEKIGTVEERKRGTLTIKYIGGLTSLSAAQQALTKAKASGFKDAYIVVDENGELKKVK
jgi:hypothetical protein